LRDNVNKIYEKSLIIKDDYLRTLYFKSIVGDDADFLNVSDEEAIQKNISRIDALKKKINDIENWEEQNKEIVRNFEKEFALFEDGPFVLEDMLDTDAIGLSDNMKESFRPLSVEDLVPFKKIETDEREGLERALRDFHLLLNLDSQKILSDIISEEQLNELYIPEKFQFLNFLSYVTNDYSQNIKDFSTKYGLHGFRTFLSMDGDISFGKKIILIGEKIDQELAQKIFDKYAEFISQLDKVESVLKESYSKEADSDEVLKIKDSILRKGKDLLVHFSDMILEGKSLSAEDVIHHLEKIEVEAMTFFLAFKTLKEEKQLPPLEEIRGISFEEKPADELSMEDRESIKKMYSENYKDNPEFLKVLIQVFEKRVARSDTWFYTLEYGNKLRASVGFTPIEGKDAIYLHSVNVENALQGISIGNTMMEKAIDEEASHSVIEADCAAYEKIGAKYIEIGFIATSQYSYEGFPAMSIVRDEKKNGEYWGKQMKGKESEILEMISKGSLPENILVESADTQKDISMKVLSEGYVMTRYFMDESTKKWYAIFEK
jgi:hypothetical protein